MSLSTMALASSGSWPPSCALLRATARQADIIFSRIGGGRSGLPGMNAVAAPMVPEGLR